MVIKHVSARVYLRYQKCINAALVSSIEDSIYVYSPRFYFCCKTVCGLYSEIINNSVASESSVKTRVLVYIYVHMSMFAQITVAMSDIEKVSIDKIKSEFGWRTKIENSRVRFL